MNQSIRRAVLAATVAIVALVPAGADAHPVTKRADNPARGVRFAALTAGQGPRCHGLWQGVHSGVCTHGPDPAPAGVDVRKQQSVRALRAASRAPLNAPLVASDTFAASTIGTTTPPVDGTGAIVCDGDGVSGNRVQVLYVVAADRTDRFASLADTLGQDAVNADRQYNASAQKTGGARHLRFVTASDGAGGCTLDIRKVVIASTADDTFDATVSALKAQGYNLNSRKYLLFSDANVYCGIGTVYIDDQSGQANASNGYHPEYARADTGCWNYAEAHELMHNLGGVQTSAPHATAGYHCWDESDVMCYDDGSGTPMQQICPTSQESLLDCNNDDYFSTAPPAGSYLSSHWNTAFSSFLIVPGTAPADTTPPAAPSGLTGTPGAGSVQLTWTANGESDLAGYRVLRGGVQIASLGKVTTFTDSGLASTGSYTYTVRAVDAAGNVSGDSTPVTVTPSPSTQTASISGKFTKSVTSASIVRATAGGPARLVGKGFVKQTAKTVAISVIGPSGQTIGTLTGTAPDLSVTLPSAGSYTFRISGVSGVSYGLTATYQG